MTIRDVYLHVGPVKTGSSYLHSIMWNSRDTFTRAEHAAADHPPQRVLPGRERHAGRPVRTGRDTRSRGCLGQDGSPRSFLAGPGSDHVRVARFSEQDHVQRIANSLAPATLHLIVMARCRADVLPSLYQEKIKMVDPTSPGKTSSAPTAPPTMRGGTPPALSSADGYRTSTSSA